jgi:tetratricopeptide (TPR) repeat protein
MKQQIDEQQLNSGTTMTEVIVPNHDVGDHQSRNRTSSRVRGIIVSTVCVVSVLAAWAALSIVESGQPPSTRSAPVSHVAQTSSPTPTQTPLERAELLSQTQPNNSSSWQQLASQYIARAYETSDPAFYTLADSALERAKELNSASLSVVSTSATLAVARHEFNKAKQLATAGLAVAPHDFGLQVALVDSLVELGEYAPAELRLDALTDQRPGVATFSRLSYLRQLNGDLVGAEAAMRSAVAAAKPNSIDEAVTLGYLGDVLLERGREAPANNAFQRALAINPNSSIAAMGVARIQASRKDWAGAVGTLETLTAKVPVPGALGQRADVARARRDRTATEFADQMVDASVSLFRANGAVVDAELAILLADRGPTFAAPALEAAQNAYADRRTIFTEDAMAWALFQSDRPAEAEPYARRAVLSAPAVASVRWHAAAIFAATGDPEGARIELVEALRNKWFSVSQRPAVEALAKELGVTS